MKKLIPIAIFIISLFPLNAQTVRLGLNAALSLTRTQYMSTEHALTFPGESAGMFAEITLSENSHLYFRPELEWSHCTEYSQYNHTNEFKSISQETETAADHISLPFLIGCSFLENKLKISVGQEISYLMKAAVQVWGTEHEYERNLDFDINRSYTESPRDYNPWGSSFIIDVGYMIHDHIGLRVRYVQRLSEGRVGDTDSAARLQTGICWYFQ